LEQIVSKIVNLSYELLGVFLPGFIFCLFLLLTWWCVGDLISVLTAGGIPTLTVDWTDAFIKKLDVKLGVGLGVPAVILSYFMGSTLVWISRSGKQDENSGAFHLLLSSLLFKIPKPVNSYSPALTPLFEKVGSKFVAPDETRLEWRQFYPVGKVFLARKLSTSLVSTYQNKYTFHRSLVLSAVTTFWLCTAAILLGLIALFCHPLGTHWWPLGIWTGFSLLMANGFTASYRLNWGLFGDTIITELYSLLFGPEAESNEPE
jgi:hypothetical protein